MFVSVRLLPKGCRARRLKLASGATAEDAIVALNLHRDAWIPVRAGEPIALDDPLKNGDELKLIAVVSGG